MHNRGHLESSKDQLRSKVQIAILKPIHSADNEEKRYRKGMTNYKSFIVFLETFHYKNDGNIIFVTEIVQLAIENF